MELVVRDFIAARPAQQPLGFDRAQGGLAAEQACRAVHDGIEDRLHVGGRTGDDLQHFCRGGLPLQRLLRLVEQPRVVQRHAHRGGHGDEHAHGGVVEGVLALQADEADRALQQIAGHHRDEDA